MANWFFGLPVVWMTLVILVLTALATALLWLAITRLAVGERTRTFTAISPGLLPVLGVIFGLLVSFVAVGVWNDLSQARSAVTAEASALRNTWFLSEGFGAGTKSRMHDLLRRHVVEAATVEWPRMSGQTETLSISAPLADALDFTLALEPSTDGQRVAQLQMTEAIQAALDARRQRIIISDHGVSGVKWFGLIAIAAIVLTAIGMAHAENRRTAAIAMSLFAGGAALSLLLIAVNSRPFTGAISVKPTVLLQAIPPDGCPSGGCPTRP